jgi:hypothetical protein
VLKVLWDHRLRLLCVHWSGARWADVAWHHPPGRGDRDRPRRRASHLVRPRPWSAPYAVGLGLVPDACGSRALLWQARHELPLDPDGRGRERPGRAPLEPQARWVLPGHRRVQLT